MSPMPIPLDRRPVHPRHLLIPTTTARLVSAIIYVVGVFSGVAVTLCLHLP